MGFRLNAGAGTPKGQSVICQSLLTLTCSDIDATSHICLH